VRHVPNSVNPTPALGRKSQMPFAGAFFYFLTRGRKKVFIKAKWDAIKGLKSALRKRKQIQSNKKVHVDYIWNLMDKETYYSRWIRRLK